MTTLERLRLELGLEKPNIADVKVLVDELGGVVTSLQSTQIKADKKLNTYTIENKEYKALIGGVNDALGVDSFTIDEFQTILNESKTDDIKEVEARHTVALQKMASEREALIKEHDEVVKNTQAELTSSKLDLAIHSVEFDGVENAEADIIRHLKDGAKLEDNGVIRFYDASGAIIRNKNQVEATLADRLEELKIDKKYLFKSEVQNTGNQHPNRSTPILDNTNNVTPFALRKQMQLKESNYGR